LLPICKLDLNIIIRHCSIDLMYLRRELQLPILPSGHCIIVEGAIADIS